MLDVFNVSSIPTDPSHEHSMKPPLGECEEMPEHNDVTSVNPLSNVQMKKVCVLYKEQYSCMLFTISRSTSLHF